MAHFLTRFLEPLRPRPPVPEPTGVEGAAEVLVRALRLLRQDVASLRSRFDAMDEAWTRRMEFARPEIFLEKTICFGNLCK